MVNLKNALAGLANQAGPDANDTQAQPDQDPAMPVAQPAAKPKKSINLKKSKKAASKITLVVKKGK